EGVTVTLSGTTGAGVTVNQTTTTDANGFYRFDNLAPGTYQIRFSDLPSGLTFSPADSGSDDDRDSDVVNAAGETASFVLSSNQTDLSRDAGLYPLLSLGNLVWVDANNNGIVDSGEEGASGIQVRLYRDSNANGLWDTTDHLVATTLTDSDGRYRFSNLPQGDYFVVLPGRQFEADSPWNGYRSSSGGLALGSGPYEPGVAANSDQDNDDNGSRQSGTESDFNIVSSLVTLRPDTEPDMAVDGDGRHSNLTIDFGIFHPAVLGDLVWNDQNGNGIQETEEPGVADVTVTLYHVGTDGIAGTADDALIATRETDGNGFYEFAELTPGDYYLVFSNLPTGGRFTANDQGSDDALDSDVDPLNGTTAAFTLVNGALDQDWDAGLVLPSSVGNLIWLDVNGNGVQDASEPGIEGVVVRIVGTDIDGNSVNRSETTADDGRYRFDGLQPGTYQVTIEVPTGYRVTAANRGGNDSADSDSDLNGAMTTFFLPGGASDLTWDAGLYQPASVGDRVWLDLNGNGAQDDGESGIAGVTVTLVGSTGAGETVNLTTTTDSNGRYRFENLVPGTYQITLDVPGGYAVTGRDRGSDNAIDSDFDPLSGSTTTFTLTSGASDLTWDAGLYQPASIGNRVWNDLNANGIAESGEEGVSGVIVNLYREDGTLVGTDVTDSSGSYLFTDLPPGSYYLEFILPGGWLFSAPAQGNDDNRDSNVDPNTSRTSVFTIDSGESDMSWWAGIHQPAPPTAITLLSFTAERQGNGVVLRWVTGSERDTVGFLILRGVSNDRAEATPLFTLPIPAQGSAGSGASYQWFDRTAQSATTYYYWLVELESDGDRNEFMLHSPAVQFTHRVLVPIILR
ncbi:SdrD B-like domain-containing protein, partial [uncultured Chloroflexus sp.]|uniref:SdrD B-like domain-containing protein n=1 Tax=uncultured Chloroflexus sp. TaxID=214040 RepID=UPI00262E71FE